jgi:hypothetical protein
MKSGAPREEQGGPINYLDVAHATKLGSLDGTHKSLKWRSVEDE